MSQECQRDSLWYGTNRKVTQKLREKKNETKGWPCLTSCLQQSLMSGVKEGGIFLLTTFLISNNKSFSNSWAFVSCSCPSDLSSLNLCISFLKPRSLNMPAALMPSLWSTLQRYFVFCFLHSSYLMSPGLCLLGNYECYFLVIYFPLHWLHY